MKRIISLTLILAVMTLVLAGCGGSNGAFAGEWVFSKISSVEINSTVDEYTLEELFLDYGVETESEFIEAALDEFNSEGTFTPCYIKFDGNRVYTYDPIMVREATWAFYKTGENEAFLSVYTDLNVADGNPDPITNPVVIYKPDSDVMVIALKYAAFMVNVELTKKG